MRSSFAHPGAALRPVRAASSSLRVSLLGRPRASHHGVRHLALDAFAGRILPASRAATSPPRRLTSPTSDAEKPREGMGLFGAAFGIGFIFGPAIAGIMSAGASTSPSSSPARSRSPTPAPLLHAARDDHARPPGAARAPGWGYFFSHLRERRTRARRLVYFLFVISFSIMTTTFVYYTKFRYAYDALHNGYLSLHRTISPSCRVD